MLIMIVATSLPPRRRTATATTTITMPMAATITATFKIPLYQIHHQIHLKINREKGTTLIVGNSMIAGLRLAKLLKNRKVKICFLPGAKKKDLRFHLIPYLNNNNSDNITIHIETDDGPYINESTIYKEIKKIKELMKTHHPDCKKTFILTNFTFG